MGSTSDPSQWDEGMLKARVEDTVRRALRRGVPGFLGFLDERQRAAAEGMLRPYRETSTLFWGGYPQGERTLLGVFPAPQEPDTTVFPLTAMGFSFRAEAQLTHRDVLGALLSAGVGRETVGDILCKEGLAVAFVRQEVAPFLIENVSRIGGEGVRARCPYEGELPAAHTFTERRDTVASPRLDAVLRVCLSLSREEAARQIAAGLVSVDHRPCLSPAAQVREGAVLSVRGAGRFRVEQLGPPTRKGRLFVTILQYH